MSLTHEQTMFVYTRAFVDELARSGVRHVCVAPGSRSTPLALTMANNPELRIWMHLDERSAAFFALGMARALNEPVALLCTSGTAAANFLPAVIEARVSSIPLVVLTADRPPELRDTGAAQTIDQNRLYGHYPKWFVEVALAESTPEMLRYARTIACRAVAMAASTPAGPVHLNFPFREPLTPAPVDPPAPSGMSHDELLALNGRPNREPWTNISDAPPVAAPAVLQAIAAQLRDARAPLLVCGPQYDAGLAAPLAAVAAAMGAPLLVDALSQLRWGPHDRCALIETYDAILRDATVVDRLQPDVILRFGGLPTSKPLLKYLERQSHARQIVIDAAKWPDPTLLAAQVIHADPAQFTTQLLDAVATSTDTVRDRAKWLATWRQLDSAAGSALAAFVADLHEPFDGAALAEVAAAVPNNATIFLSSSMPVRDMDSFARGDGRTVRVLSNRGANGIDGVVSSALGVAATLDHTTGPLVLIIGDIAFYHDMNGLLAARLHHLNATIVVLNNDGGGIFSFLPQAADQTHFEQLFGTPHGLHFKPVAELYGAHYHAARTVHELRDGVRAGIDGGGLHIVELCTDRARNQALHREAWAAAAQVLQQSPSN